MHIYEGKTELQPVPERRPIEKQARAHGTATLPAKTEAKAGTVTTTKKEEEEISESK